jgi:hypothetical protein
MSWSHATVSLAPAHVCLVCTFLRPSTPCAAPRRVLSHMHARYHRTCGGFRPHVVSTESLPSSSLQCTHVHPLTAHTRTHTHTHTHTHRTPLVPAHTRVMMACRHLPPSMTPAPPTFAPSRSLRERVISPRVHLSLSILRVARGVRAMQCRAVPCCVP